MTNNLLSQQYIDFLCREYERYNNIDPGLFSKYGIKRGLRNSDGSGVAVGITLLCNVHGYIIDEGEAVPIPGELIYRGINVREIVDGCIRDNRFGFEETIWLLLFGFLPSKQQLADFKETLGSLRELPESFADKAIMSQPSPNIMNKLSQSLLSLYAFDERADDFSLDNLIRQSINLIAKFPAIMIESYRAKRRHFDKEDLPPYQANSEYTTAEYILSSLRPNEGFTDEEAKLLDLCLILHAEHGGGNNSTFTCRVLSSARTDTYAALAGAVSSLKGSLHGGANSKVVEMMEYAKGEIKDWNNYDEVCSYVEKLIDRKAGDGSGLVYGIGHAVYTLSDPRAVILKAAARSLAEKTGFEKEFRLLENLERAAVEIIKQRKGRTVCANVDMYSGLIYKILKIPQDLYTPIFAASRIASWSAHRIEEIFSGNKIIRPAYRAIAPRVKYINLEDR